MRNALPGSRTAPLPRSSRTSLLVTVAAVAIVALLLRACIFHENPYERIAREVTVALQHDDLATVEKYQNAETSLAVNHERVGRAADTLSPLGPVKSVKQTAFDPNTLIYDFDLTFEHGTAHERIQFDPQRKIVHFAYNEVKRT